jgi:hypothetical protein
MGIHWKSTSANYRLQELQENIRFSQEISMVLCGMFSSNSIHPRNKLDQLKCASIVKHTFLACIPYSEKMKVYLWNHHAVYVNIFPLFNFWMPEPIFMKLSMYIMTLEPISMTFFMHPFRQSVCLYVYSHIVIRQRLGKNFTAATNTRAAIEESLDALFSMWSVSYQRKVAISSSQNFLYLNNI